MCQVIALLLTFRSIISFLSHAIKNMYQCNLKSRFKQARVIRMLRNLIKNVRPNNLRFVGINNYLPPILSYRRSTTSVSRKELALKDEK